MKINWEHIMWAVTLALIIVVIIWIARGLP